MNRYRYRVTLQQCGLTGKQFSRVTGVYRLAGWMSFHIWPTRSCVVALRQFELLQAMTEYALKRAPRATSTVNTHPKSDAEAADEARAEATLFMDEFLADPERVAQVMREQEGMPLSPDADKALGKSQRVPIYTQESDYAGTFYHPDEGPKYRWRVRAERALASRKRQLLEFYQRLLRRLFH